VTFAESGEIFHGLVDAVVVGVIAEPSLIRVDPHQLLQHMSFGRVTPAHFAVMRRACVCVYPFVDDVISTIDN
jgi:hypothetical protein